MISYRNNTFYADNPLSALSNGSWLDATTDGADAAKQNRPRVAPRHFTAPAAVRWLIGYDEAKREQSK